MSQVEELKRTCLDYAAEIRGLQRELANARLERDVARVALFQIGNGATMKSPHRCIDLVIKYQKIAEKAANFEVAA